MSPVEPGSVASPVTVAYIGGWGRSGSTLMARLLGEVDGYAFVGEIRDVFMRGVDENRVCGCGERFRDCEFWGPVGVEAYGGWDEIDPAIGYRLRSLLDRPWRFEQVVRPGSFAAIEAALAEAQQVYGPLYRAMATVSGSQVIVDSSKYASWGAVLARLGGIDPRFIHLVRDPRGSIHSWMKSISVDVESDNKLFMAQYNPADAALRYDLYNSQMRRLGRLGHPYRLVRYEDLVRAPEAILRPLLEFVGHGATDDVSEFLVERKVRLQPSHSVMGNPMRHNIGWVEVAGDEMWREKMSPATAKMISVITAPLLRRYGYPVAP